MFTPDGQNDSYRQHSAYGYDAPAYTEGAAVGPIKAVRGAFANWNNWDGRASRSAYWWFQLFSAAIWGIFSITWVLLRAGHAGPALLVFVRAYFELVVLIAVALIALIPTTYSLTVRRLHDSDSTGLLVLIGFIPVVGTLQLLAMVCRPGTPGPNRYG
jgi:uncharacterized membrane protein YhaH (DUF805 family)